jgi:hypothetical protein
VKKFRGAVYLFSIIAIINFLNKYTNFSEIINTGSPKVEINEEYIVYDEKDDEVSKNKDINKIDLNDLKNIGISKNKISKIKEYKNFIGSIYDIEKIYGISKQDKEKIDKYYFVSDVKFNKYNINELNNRELKILGFANKEVEYIEYLKSKGNINSNIDLKDKVNNEILKRSIKFDE